QARPLIWREQDKIATDPAEDWIQTYGTEDSEKEFEFKTDLARDLLGVWVRCGTERLYIRLDYNSPRDLEGLVFQDTLLLFDYDSPDQGYRQISQSTEWERGAERQILIRHWFNHSEKSQYDLEILDETGEVRSRFLTSGFADPNYPYFDVIDLIQGEHGSVVFSISRDVLDLKNARKVFLQVCTLKGGIEVHKKKELPRETMHDGRPICDVADSFGPENSAARLQADFEQNIAPIIRGYAACFDLNSEDTVGTLE
ncbi:MAG: hypothetical protein ABIH23_20530, partial [bacterium]